MADIESDPTAKMQNTESIAHLMAASETIPDRSPLTGIRRFVEHYGSTLLGQGSTLGLGILTGVLAARMLGPTGRGEYAAIIVWPMAIAGFLAFGVNQAIAFYLGQRSFTVSEIATGTGVIGLVQSALSVLIGLAVIPFALANQSRNVLYLGILFVLFTPALFGMYSANLFQGMQDLGRFNLIRTLTPLVYAVGLLALFFAHRGTLTAVIVAQLLGYIVTLAVGAVLVWKILRPRIRWNPATIPRLLHYGVRIQGLSVATYFNQRIDQLVLSLLVAPKQLGFYAVAVSLSSAIAILPQAAGIVAFSRGSGQDSEGAKDTVGIAFRASLIWLLVACTMLFLLAPWLIRTVFGSAFEGSILACRILLPGAIATGLGFVLYNAASALGKPGLASYAESSSVLVTAGGLYLLVPRFGYVGAAIVSSVAYTVSFLVMLVLARQVLGIRLRTLLFGGFHGATPWTIKQ